MAISALSAARRLCDRSGWTISNLELQKYLYIAHMLHLGTIDRPLIGGFFEAWDYGPVQRDVYQAAKVFGRSPIKDIFRGVPEAPEGTESATLDDALRQLKDAAPGRLVAITHWENGAWAKHYHPGKRNAVIPNSDIRQEYLDRMNAARQRAG